MKTTIRQIAGALATGAMMALAPVAAHAGTVTVSGRIEDGNNSAVGGATCTVEFASYDGKTIITTKSDQYNGAAYSVTLPSGKKYRVWCKQDNGSIYGEAILDLNGVTGPVTDQNYGMHSPSYCVTYNGEDTRYFLSLDFAEAFIARTPSAESLVTVNESGASIREMLVGRDWMMSPVIALRSAASSDVYAFLKPTSADASNFVECAAFTNGVKISAGQTTPESAVTMSLKSNVADGQSIKLTYEVELRATNDATAPLLTTPQATLSKFENYLAVVGDTPDVELTYDGEGHFITVNTNGLSRVITNGDNTSLEKVSVQYSYEKDGRYRSKKWTPTLTNACDKTVVYYTIGNDKAYVNVYEGSATVTILPQVYEETDEETIYKWEATGATTAKITGFKNASQKVTAMVIPDKIEGYFITEIARGAFANSKCGATSVKLPRCCTKIGFRAFSGIKTLASVTFVDVLDYEHLSNETTLEIGEYAFAATALTSVTTPSCVSKIGDYAFADCRKLTSVTCADSTTFGTRPFRRAGVDMGITEDLTVTTSGMQVTGKAVRMTFSVAASVPYGAIDADALTVSYRPTLDAEPTTLTPTVVGRAADGSVTVEVTPPEGASSGFFQATLATED